MEYTLVLKENVGLYKFSVALSERFGIDFSTPGNYIVFMGDCYMLYCDKILDEQELQKFVENYQEIEDASQGNI